MNLTLLPLGPALAVKLLVWSLALALFLRMTARELGGADAASRARLQACLLGAIAGSKLLHALAYPALFAEEPGRAALLAASGDSVPGALIGARLALGLAGPPAGALADRLLPGAAAALLVLHLGAALWAMRGTDYGGPTDLPWGVDFGDGIARHPVMIYDAAMLGIAWIAQRSLIGARPAEGARCDLFLFTYLALLSVTSYLKPPFRAAALPEVLLPVPHAWWGIATAEQIACVLTVAALGPAWLAVLNHLHGRR